MEFFCQSECVFENYYMALQKISGNRMKTIHRIVNGDSRQMDLIADESVHLIITSPPYWQLKDYGMDNQIGYHETYEEYINNLNLVWKDCHRVLHPGCRLCINIGDQFARSVYYGRYKVIPIRTEITRFCEAIGFDYMGAVIWQKVTTTNTTGGATIMGSFPYPRNGIMKINYEFILLFRKQGTMPKPSREQKALSEISKEDWNTYFSGHWHFAGVKQKDHIAMFPEELPARLIKMFAFAGDTVLDPFLGSGTTSVAARNLGRNSIGYEINPDFINVIKRKFNIGQADLAGTEYIFMKSEIKTDLNEKIKNLPYIFKDPHKLDKKIDPKKHQFGSGIDGNIKEREKYHSVSKVISPELLVLGNGSLVRLLGVKENKALNSSAVNFLTEKTRGQKVFLKFDKQRYDSNNRLLCYLYLKNKTFLNAHLIKKGFAEVDYSIEFRYREKFIKLRARQGK